MVVMKLAGLLLLASGWGIVFAATALLVSPLARASFVLAGVAVEAVGLAVAARGHLPHRGERK